MFGFKGSGSISSSSLTSSGSFCSRLFFFGAERVVLFGGSEALSSSSSPGSFRCRALSFGVGGSVFFGSGSQSMQMK